MIHEYLDFDKETLRDRLEKIFTQCTQKNFHGAETHLKSIEYDIEELQGDLDDLMEKVRDVRNFGWCQECNNNIGHNYDEVSEQTLCKKCGGKDG